MNGSVFWTIPRGFVHSSRGQCNDCQNVTMLYLSKTEKNNAFRGWTLDQRGYKHVDALNTLCVNCINRLDQNFIRKNSEQLRFSGGTFKCPARVCKGNCDFEMFIKRECCPAARSARVQELFSEFDKQVSAVERHFSASDIDSIRGRINEFNKKLNLTQYYLAKNQFKQLGETLKIAKRDCKAETVDDIKNELDSFNEKFANFFPINDRNSCAICMEKYDGQKCIESTLLCGHRACFECLNKLPNKNCPTCRKAFTNEQIIKLF